MATARQKRSVWPLGHVAKPKPCSPAGGSAAGGLLGAEKRQPGSAEQPGDARSASPNLLITHFRTCLSVAVVSRLFLKVVSGIR